MPADFDTKAAALRRVARELGRKDQAALALDLPMFFFKTEEQAEAKAIVALELYRLNRGSPEARKTADELKAMLSSGAAGKVPPPTSAQALWLVLNTEKAPTLFAPAAGTQTDMSRLAYVATNILKDEPGKALKLLNEPGGSLAGQLRAYTLYAEWAPDPGPAFAAAVSVINSAARDKTKKETFPPSLVLRLSQLAAATGHPEDARTLADLIPDEGLRAWAKGSCFQFQATAENKSKLDDAWFEMPADPSKLRAGHAWGKLWLARHNARLGQKETLAAVNLWNKGTIRPFGLVGAALAQHDRNQEK
jgi:hypothetical protein